MKFAYRIKASFFLPSHELAKLIGRKQLLLSSSMVQKLYFSVYPRSLFQTIGELSDSGDYDGVEQLVFDNLGLLILLKKADIILKAAYHCNDQDTKVRYMLLAIYIKPSLITGVLFSHLTASIGNFDLLKRSLIQWLNKQMFSINDELIIKSYLNVEVIFPNVEVNTYVLSNSLLDKDELIEERYLIDGTDNMTKQVKNLTFSSLVNRGNYSEAQKILDSQYECINNANIVKFYHSQGKLIDGYLAMKERDMSKACSSYFGDRYIQSIDSIKSSESLLLLASWGIGDDIRYSVLIPSLLELHPNIHFSCEPRLKELLRHIYPEANIISSNRSKFVSRHNFESFHKLPYRKLHHVMDNNLYEFSRNVDKICLFTDVLSSIDYPCHNSRALKQTASHLCQPSETIIDDFFSNLRQLSANPIIGICWRSMLSRPTRNEHYFDLEELLFEFKGRNLTVVILQYDLNDNERDVIENFKTDLLIFEPPIDQMNDFLSVVYLMKSLDYIISAGTAVLELAGVSGTSTYLLSNSPSQKYRFKGGIDIWFQNIKSIEEFYNLTKHDVQRAILDEIEYCR